MADVVIEGVTKTYRDIVAIDALDLTVKDGEFVVLLGPSGAGKTTTLRLIAGLERPDTGTIRIAGRGTQGVTLFVTQGEKIVSVEHVAGEAAASAEDDAEPEAGAD